MSSKQSRTARMMAGGGETRAQEASNMVKKIDPRGDLLNSIDPRDWYGNAMQYVGRGVHASEGWLINSRIEGGYAATTI